MGRQKYYQCHLSGMTWHFLSWFSHRQAPKPRTRPQTGASRNAINFNHSDQRLKCPFATCPLISEKLCIFSQSQKLTFKSLVPYMPDWLSISIDEEENPTLSLTGKKWICCNWSSTAGAWSSGHNCSHAMAEWRQCITSFVGGLGLWATLKHQQWKFSWYATFR